MDAWADFCLVSWALLSQALGLGAEGAVGGGEGVVKGVKLPVSLLEADGFFWADPGLLNPEVLACFRVSAASAAAMALTLSRLTVLVLLLLLLADIFSRACLTCWSRRGQVILAELRYLFASIIFTSLSNWSI